MVEEPTGVIPPERPPRRHRAKTSSGRILLRRLIALGFVLGVLALLVGSAWAILDARGSDPPPPPAPVAAPPKPLRIIFPEGFTREQMAARIGEVNQIAEDKRNVTPRLSPDRYRALTRGASKVPPQFRTEGRPPHLEGFLFPATYEFTAKTTTRQLVNKQLTAFRRNWSRLNLRYARSKNLTPYDVLIIASMVEKEVIAPEERALVAAVIYNRLKAGMTLGIDATIRYGLGVPPTESLRVSHLNDPTPYNTRIHPGLPPTPIANPGLASLQAAAHPAKVNYLFFVRKPDKIHHFFTASEREFINYLNANGY
ncbi:MAG TPA: endolytic transglycosylase MltG [Gaiellaceae bacterium]|nr:endolytic transglycosylase MltG [Gaiellaceae bacterium]